MSLAIAYQPSNTLNVENILKVADAIEQHIFEKIGFSMLVVYALVNDDALVDKSDHNCETIACIAGWTLLAHNEKPCFATAESASSSFQMYKAGKILGLYPEIANSLFMPPNYRENKTDDKQAVRTLRHLAKTGLVDFTV